MMGEAETAMKGQDMQATYEDGRTSGQKVLGVWLYGS